MYKELINYVKTADFSPSIFYNLLDSDYIMSYYNPKIMTNILKKQNKNSLEDIIDLDYSLLNLEEVLTLLYCIYHVNNNLSYPSKMYNDGKLEKIMDRLSILDDDKKYKKFDDRIYFKLRNLFIKSSLYTAFTNNRFIISFDSHLKFYENSKNLNFVDIYLDLTHFSLKQYLFALKENKWIKIYEPEYENYFVIYPDVKLQKIIKSNSQ